MPLFFLVKFNKILFFSTLMMGTLISISSFSWFSMWMGLEINMLSFIPLMNEKKTPLSSEASFKYFIVQAISSMLILFSFILSLISSDWLIPLNFSLEIIFNSALLTKMGAAPFHFWFPEILEGLTWMNTAILLTWQKLAPMILVMYNSKMNYFFFSIILISLLVSSFKNFNQTSMKKIMAFSSINHLGWMLSILLINQSLWMFYFIFYSFTTFSLIFLFKETWISSIQDLFKILNSSKPVKLFFYSNFLSMGGLPPFLGFFPKWMILKSLWFENQQLLAILMIIFTLIMLFVYIRLLYQSMIFKTKELNLLISKSNFYFFHILNFWNLLGLVIFSLILNL